MIFIAPSRCILSTRSESSIVVLARKGLSDSKPLLPRMSKRVSSSLRDRLRASPLVWLFILASDIFRSFICVLYHFYKHPYFFNVNVRVSDPILNSCSTSKPMSFCFAISSRSEEHTSELHSQFHLLF